MWCQCLVWLFLVAFVGKKKEQTINVLLGAYKLLLTLQSLCPEPSQAPGCGRGREGAVWRAWRPSCMHSFGEEKNKDLEEAFPWDDVRSLRRGSEAPVCKGHVLTGKGICSGIDMGPVFHLSSGPGKGLEKKKKTQKWVGQYLNSVVIFLLEEGNFLGKREFFSAQ